MARCLVCGSSRSTISKVLGVCGACIKDRFEESSPFIARAHATTRQRFSLPVEAPHTPKGVRCKLCVHGCTGKKGEIGYCGLPLGDRSKAHVSWYFDPLPTNCVADFVCPGGTGCGYPKWAHRPGPERGWKNLAVFYEACSFNCLFCQNWSFRVEKSARLISPEELVSAIDDRTACICFFGGDPTPQLPHSIASARIAMTKFSGRLLRVCWETNGCMDPDLLDEMVEIALSSGGCIKFDLKAWDDRLHVALTGVSNQRTKENFLRVAARVRERPEVPLLVASTLLVPGYVDANEVYEIAKFIARCDPSIPYVLLAFHPEFMMNDLPTTSADHAWRALEAAREAGLVRVRVGNLHLIRESDYS